MITKEELDILLNEKMKNDAFDILVDDCCNVVSKKLEYKKQYKEIYDLKFLLARLYYFDLDFKEKIIEIYELLNMIEIENNDIIYTFYSIVQYMNNMSISKKTLNVSYELKYLINIGKEELARRIIEENYYYEIFSKILKRNNIVFCKEENFIELCRKVDKIQIDYSKKITRIFLEKNELKKIRLLLDYSEDFSNRKLIMYDRKQLEHLIDEWLFENAYDDLKNLFINKFLQMIDEESEEEDLDKLLDELYEKICSSRSKIARECEEIKYRMTHTFATNDERNEENLNRLLDLYEMIQNK